MKESAFCLISEGLRQLVSLHNISLLFSACINMTAAGLENISKALATLTNLQRIHLNLSQ